jgi:hypothetical protein
MGLNAAAEWTPGVLLTRGNVTAVPLAAGASTTLDVLCEGDSELTIMADMTGAANGDLTVGVFPFEADGVTVMANVGLTAIRSGGPTFGTGAVQYNGTYDVSGVDKVRIVVRNNNAGAQTLTRLGWRLS